MQFGRTISLETIISHGRGAAKRATIDSGSALLLDACIHYKWLWLRQTSAELRRQRVELESMEKSLNAKAAEVDEKVERMKADSRAHAASKEAMRQTEMDMATRERELKAAEVCCCADSTFGIRTHVAPVPRPG